MGEGEANTWTYSGVQRPAVPRRILSRKAGQTEYRVFRTRGRIGQKVS